MCLPVLESLHLVHDHEVGLKAAPCLHVVAHCVVGHNFIGLVLIILRLALECVALNDMHRPEATGETLYLAFPLILERGGAHHKHLRYISRLHQHLGSANGLHGLAQTHLVGNERASGGGGKAYAFSLVGIEARVQHGVEVVVAQGCNGLLASAAFTQLKHVLQGIVVATERPVDAAALFQQVKEVLHAMLVEDAIAVEVGGSQLLVVVTVVGAHAHAHLAHLAHLAIAEVYRGVGRFIMLVAAFVGVAPEPQLYPLQVLARVQT